MPGMLDLISVLFGRGVHGPRAQSLFLSLSLSELKVCGEENPIHHL